VLRIIFIWDCNKFPYAHNAHKNKEKLMPKNETAEYIALMVEELASMAKSDDLPLIAYLLGMAREAAAKEAKMEAAQRTPCAHEA
jgi:hypothetical protein